MSSLSKTKLNQLSKALNYTFSDISLLEKALSHRSVGSNNNERLEFLGDSLLNFLIAENLYQRFPKAREGDLSRLRASLVKGETLAELAKDFDLGEFLYLGEGELKSGGFRRASILADAVEALIGAIYLESGMDRCRDTVLHWFGERLDSIDLNSSVKDPKTRLQEYLQELRQPLPVYTVESQLGQAHSPEFQVSCDIGRSQGKTVATSSSKRNAEKLAAAAMLKQLGVR
ncbi:ribonuclease III [Teredinibacter turnerae]|uniref:ribonuclease III n=1 Tax=Teredinibacter turnerae TaxID=2426 RepID=UPI00040AA25C|nr:ribonuclease III [Teredinibacter turnerae]